jgi:hypothetical protein
MLPTVLAWAISIGAAIDTLAEEANSKGVTENKSKQQDCFFLE